MRRLNKKQKYVLVSTGIVIAIVFVLWIGTGAEIYTKQQVPVQHVDAIFGTTSIEWKHVFVIGLDFTISAAIVVLVLAGVLLFVSRTKRAA